MALSLTMCGQGQAGFGVGGKYPLKEAAALGSGHEVALDRLTSFKKREIRIPDFYETSPSF